MVLQVTFRVLEDRRAVMIAHKSAQGSLKVQNGGRRAIEVLAVPPPSPRGSGAAASAQSQQQQQGQNGAAPSGGSPGSSSRQRSQSSSIPHAGSMQARGRLVCTPVTLS
jgi:hypothetical protein